MSERFNEVEAFNLAGLDAWVRKPDVLVICTGDDSADMNIAEIRALRDWLNKALPDNGTESTNG